MPSHPDRNPSYPNRGSSFVVPNRDASLLASQAQTLFQFSVVTNVAESTQFPEPARSVVGGLGIFNLDFLSYVPAECVYPNSDFYTKLLVKTIGPLIVAVGLWAVPLVHLIQDDKRGFRVSAQTAASRTNLFLELILPSISTTISEAFYCEKFDGDRFLRAQLTQSCESSEWQSWAVYAGLFIIVFPIGEHDRTRTIAAAPLNPVCATTGVPAMLFYDVFIYRKDIEKVMKSLEELRGQGGAVANVARLADMHLGSVRAIQVKSLASKFEVRDDQ